MRTVTQGPAVSTIKGVDCILKVTHPRTKPSRQTFICRVTNMSLVYGGKKIRISNETRLNLNADFISIQVRSSEK